MNKELILPGVGYVGRAAAMGGFWGLAAAVEKRGESLECFFLKAGEGLHIIKG